MLKIYKTNKDKSVDKIEEIVSNCWIDMLNPTEEEIDKVVDKTKIDKDLIVKMLDEEERPRIETSDTDTLIVIDTPYLAYDEGKMEFTTYPLGIIISKNNYSITVSPRKVNILRDFKHNKIKNFKTNKKTRFLIQILLKTSELYQKALKQLNKEITKTEEQLKNSTKNSDLIDMLEIEKTLVYFLTSLKANDLVLEKLNQGKVVELFDNDKDLLDDAIIENKQAIEMSEIYRNILNSITETYANVVSNNVNNLMKLLAAVTIILSIPNIITSFLGMNLHLSLAKLPGSEYIVLGSSVFICIIVAIILKKKGML